MKKILFLLFCILVYSNVFSQKNYLPGYIINNEKDTIKGYINYRNWNINPKKISFRGTNKKRLLFIRLMR